LETITREELREKMDREDEFVLVDRWGRSTASSRTCPARSTCPLRR